MRDQRIDELGFINELVKHHAEPLKDKIKHGMTLAGAKCAEGDSFVGSLMTPTVNTIDPNKFLRLFEMKHITRKQLLSALRVSNEAAKEFLSPEVIGRISTEAPGTDRLTVARIKGVQITLVNAVKHIAAAVEHTARNPGDEP